MPAGCEALLSKPVVVVNNGLVAYLFRRGLRCGLCSDSRSPSGTHSADSSTRDCSDQPNARRN